MSSPMGYCRRAHLLHEKGVNFVYKWIQEDWTFEIAVKKGQSKDCRMGFEEGDTFSCQYECPAGFCPKTIPVLYTLCEIVRCGGNYRLKGSRDEYEIDFPCADGCIQFHLMAQKLIK